MVTKTIGLLVEDFLERINEALQSQEDFSIESSIFPIGSLGGIVLELVSEELGSEYGYIKLRAWLAPEETPLDLRRIKVTGVCGNLNIRENESEFDFVDLGCIDMLKEAMTTSGNHKLDLQLTFHLKAEMKTDNCQWIIPRKKPRFSEETLMTNQSKNFTDFTLESVDGAKFPCHRVVLAAQSSVLRRMFLSPLEESQASRLQLEYKADLVKKFLQFFYKAEIEEDEEEGNLRRLLELAEKYDITHLKVEVERLAIRKLTVENMVDLFLLADFYSAKDLKNAAEGFIKTNQSKVKEGLAEFEKLEKNQLIKIMNIFID